MKGNPASSPDIILAFNGKKFPDRSSLVNGRSVSVDNINEYLKLSPAGSSTPSSGLAKDALSVNILNQSLPLKALRKRLGFSQKFSRSNQDGLERLGEGSSGIEWKKLRKADSGSVPPSKDERAKFLSLSDMRKASRPKHESGTGPQRPSHVEQTSAAAAPSTVDRGRRHRHSLDSTDQYVIVDNAGAEDPLDAGNAYETGDEVDAPDGPDPDSGRTLHEVDRLNRKIEKTREELIRLQTTKDENVQEYLKASGHLTDPETNQKVKINFEKSNLKTNLSIQALQRKLEKYQRMLRACEERGVQGPRRVLRGVHDSVKSGASRITGAVSKPLESLNHLIKKDKKVSSNENVAVFAPSNEDDTEKSVYSAFSDEENSSSGSNHCLANSSGSVPSSGVHNEETDALGHSRSNHDLMELVEKANKDLVDTVATLKEQVEYMGRSLQEERYQSEQLRAQLVDLMNQWNDMTELHQNEMMGLKSDLERAEERIECVNYRSAERADEIEEAVESCVTRVSKMELQQHQQQQLLLSVDGYFDGSGNGKLLFSKFLSIVISVFAIILVVLSSATRIAMPFISTRTRLLVTSVCLASIILAWNRQDQPAVQFLLDSFKLAVMPIVRRLTESSDTSPSESTRSSLGDSLS